MAFKIKFSEQADADLSDIISYLRVELCSPKAAERLYGSVSHQLDVISKNPRVYPLHHDERLRAQGLRFVAIGSYLMFYVADDTDSIAHIVRIVYGKKNLFAVFDS